MTEISNQFHLVNGRPIPKEPLNFYQFKQGNRLFVNVTDSHETWKQDLCISERMFAETLLCTPSATEQETKDELVRVQDILKQRMKYPGAREDPAIEKIAKTWVLPTKVHMGPSLDSFFGTGEFRVRGLLDEYMTRLQIQDSVIHFLKIEVSDGNERQFVYQILDSGFRPSLILIKWSHDLDDHIPTAHCAGHLMNTGYALVSLENGYAMYMFLDHTLYDTCSMKSVALENPFIDSITQSVLEAIRASRTDESTQSTTTNVIE